MPLTPEILASLRLSRLASVLGLNARAPALRFQAHDILGWKIIEAPAPPVVADLISLNIVTRLYFWAGQFPGFGLGYQGSRSLMRWNVTPAQWNAITFGMAETTFRLVYLIGISGSLPVIVCPDNIDVTDGQIWELTCFNQGWFYEDPPGIFDPKKIPPGPEYGQAFSAPNYTSANIALASGSSDWWQYT